MIDYKAIRDLHLEISTYCNASCPWCPRNFWGYPFNGGYPEVNLTLSNTKKIFPDQFIQQLSSIRVNGNFGDIVMNPEGLDIIGHFRSVSPGVSIDISTNGSARAADFWVGLARVGAVVHFALDGLEDTHHLYRQNTVWKTVIKNARTFIANDGRAVWKMIQFRHNQHQIDAARSMSKDLGFERFDLAQSQRTSAPVFDKHGNLSHVLGDYQDETRFDILFFKKINDEVLLEDITPGRTPKKNIDCETKRLKSIYVAANGDVSPCCYTGFYPNTYGKGQYHQAVNAQLTPLIAKNNALEYPLEQCIQWFQAVEASWNKSAYQDGRLVICDDNCGSDF